MYSRSSYVCSFYRASKTSARKLISDSLLTTPRGKGDEGESDDSLVGDHSPFVRQTAKRCIHVHIQNIIKDIFYLLSTGLVVIKQFQC